MRQSLRASTHYAIFGGSLVFSCFHVLLVIYYSMTKFFLFLIKLYNLQKHENTKTLNYGQKVHSVYSPLKLTLRVFKINVNIHTFNVGVKGLTKRLILISNQPVE
jgi:hypothetical protein